LNEGAASGKREAVLQFDFMGAGCFRSIIATAAKRYENWELRFLKITGVSGSSETINPSHRESTK